MTDSKYKFTFTDGSVKEYSGFDDTNHHQEGSPIYLEWADEDDNMIRTVTVSNFITAEYTPGSDDEDEESEPEEKPKRKGIFG